MYRPNRCKKCNRAIPDKVMELALTKLAVRNPDEEEILRARTCQCRATLLLSEQDFGANVAGRCR